MAEESLDALFAMRVPVPLDVARSLVEGIDSILQGYARLLPACLPVCWCPAAPSCAAHLIELDCTCAI